MSEIVDLLQGRELPSGVPVYLTESAPDIDTLLAYAEAAGVKSTGSYWGDGYDAALPAKDIIRWDNFRGARLEVTPKVPLRGWRYLIAGSVHNNPQVFSGVADHVFEVEDYQVNKSADGHKSVRAWTVPTADGHYEIIDVPEGDATFRLVWSASKTDTTEAVLRDMRREEMSRHDRFRATVRSALAKLGLA
jgi:hypothetical protein